LKKKGKMPSGWMKNLAQLDSDHVSKLIGKKQALGSSSRKTEKKKKVIIRTKEKKIIISIKIEIIAIQLVNQSFISE